MVSTKFNGLYFRGYTMADTKTTEELALKSLIRKITDTAILIQNQRILARLKLGL
jgi:hypothetical protein